jgi:hypothetical protein
MKHGKALLLTREIQKTKKRLANRAKRNGLWENFGQKDVHKIKDKFDYHSLSYGSEEERTMAREIEVFNNWCMNFNDAQLAEY